MAENKSLHPKNDNRPLQSSFNFEEVSYNDDKAIGEIEKLQLDADHDTIWASTEQMAKLFGKNNQSILEVIRDIFRDGELDETTVTRMLPIISEDGRGYRLIHYNLDVILSVGYRVSSRQATKFRQWATSVLKRYIIQGYALDERRLDDDPSALHKLASDVRALRTKEKNIYEAVRECFKISSTDYDPASKETRSFYAKLQDKFLYAITGQTSAQVVLDRADGLKDFMGLTSTKNGRPTKSDATVGKNYLNPEELYTLHLLCEQFLLFFESNAIRGHSFTMSEISAKFDEMIKLNGYPVFKEYGSYIVVAAKKHAERELDLYRQRMKVEGKTLGGRKTN